MSRSDADGPEDRGAPLGRPADEGMTPAVGDPRAPSNEDGGEPPIWPTIVAAVKGTALDLTEAPLRQAIILMAVPMVLEMVMESVFAVVDIFWVTRLGANAVAAVGLTESMYALVYTVAMGLSIGVTATVARRIGEKDEEGAARAAVQAIILGVGVSVVIGVLGGVFAEEMLAVMGAPPDLIADGAGYTRVLFAGNASVVLLFLINAAFRGAGDATVAMRVLWFANGINLVLDPCLIFGLGPFPELGVTGAAAATVTGRGLAVLVQLWVLFRLSDRLRVAARHVAVELETMATVIRLSAAGTLQTFIATASWIGLVRVLSTFGPEALAGYTIGVRIILFALLPSWGMANAAATLVGQGLGAGKPERAERAVWLAGRLNFYFLGTVGVLLIVFARPVVAAFGPDPATADFAVRFLQIVCGGFFFYAYGMVLTQSFNGAGDTWTPTWINLGCFWLFEIPAAYVMAHPLGMGPPGVFLALALAYSALAVVSGVIFKQGRWKEKRV
jgi:putative MATE family efflux protein